MGSSGGSSGGAAALPYQFLVASYGARGDGKIVADGATTNGSPTLTSATAAFTVADVGKAIMVVGGAAAGVTSLVTTIAAYVNATTVTLTANAAATKAGAYVLWATDDTTAFQNTINAAFAYAQTHSQFAQVVIPAPTGAFYGIAGALSHANSGNAQLTIPVVAEASIKVVLEFVGAGDATALFHWDQTIPQVSGSTLVGFGVYASTVAQTADINAHGNPAVIGGATQPNGYGEAALLFSNMMVVVKDLAIFTTFSSNGIGYGACDFSGIAEANGFDFAYGVTALYTDLQNPIPLATGLSIGFLMPANGNNDNNVLRNVSCLGGYTYALFATEHCVINALRVTYCWAALVVVGSYFGSVGASHAVCLDQFSCEACIRHVYLLGSGQGGQGPTINISQLDTEGAPIFYDGSAGGTGGDGLGEVGFTGYNAPSCPNPTGIKFRNLIRQPGYVATPSYALGTAFVNDFWRDATVIVRGGTVTDILIGKPTAGVACLGGSAAPAMQSTGLTAGTFRVPSGAWFEIAGSVAPTCIWQLD